MRIISGSARGRKLFSPEGRDVRPTTDKVKESIFNIVRFELGGAVVLDLFAGTGQLGIEALSCGAEKAVFVDSSRRSIEVIKKNVEVSGFSSCSEIVFGDAFSFLAGSSEKFDIVLLDPPYHHGLCAKAFGCLPAVLNDDSTVICETQNDEILPALFGDFCLLKEYNYSAIKLSVYRRNVSED